MSVANERGLAHELVLKLGKPIVLGRWNGESVFPTEQQLCQQHGVSRSVVREAVKVLRSKGLIESRPKRGIRILPRDQWNFWDADVLSWLEKDNRFFEDLAVFRMSIEPTVASLAAVYASDEQISEMFKLGQEMETAEKSGDVELFNEVDFQFHQKMAEACGNMLMQQMMKVLNPLISLNRERTLHLVTKVESTVPLHQNLATAIGKRQTKKACTLMKEIITEARYYAIQG